ncbi:hypothetical protein [Butyrivibrio sp. INlla16]|uniref:hypothetical protein n=1 Tax=Butyrivibrio sp. INlla16 TaxID=1520807 RepID=UPI0008850229|nr:hypothetical protein [Butyrivibrio sp. INlla16]SDB63112.1 hypothetical protein SAMN02910263_03458 [Butyrivibrio sp. INlla16]
MNTLASTSTQTTVISGGLNFVSVGMEKWFEIYIRINWLAMIVLLLTIWVLVYIYRKFIRKRIARTIIIDGVEFGFSNFKCKVRCSHEIQEIAYKLWVELTTRKIAVPLEEDDVIVEVYNSWYDTFSAIRELLKSVPGGCLDDASELIAITTRVLNEGLRPHLTKWQAKYRSWYNIEVKKDQNKNKTPQEIQKKFPEYEMLLEDMKNTNKNMINYAKEMKRIAFSKRENE